MTNRKTITILFAFVLLLPLVFSGGLQVFQVYLKHRAEQRLQTETIFDLSFPLHKVKWVEQDREIMVDGKMYDLQSYHEEDGMLIAKGIYDEHESRVMNVLHNFNEKDQNQLIIRVLLLIQIFAVVVQTLAPIFQPGIFKKQFLSFSSSIPLPVVKKIYQPPRQFHSY
ncbi:MAG TPA: hypothetical protein VGC29_00595 [Flavisolibacter sp.]